MHHAILICAIMIVASLACSAGQAPGANTHTPIPTETVEATYTPTVPEQIATIFPETPTSAMPTTDVVATAAAKCICDRDAYNCADPEARTCFSECNRRGAGDVHKLDRDGDGRACDWY